MILPDKFCKRCRDYWFGTGLNVSLMFLCKKDREIFERWMHERRR
jgi:hypothetical protein